MAYWKKFNKPFFLNRNDMKSLLLFTFFLSINIVFAQKYIVQIELHSQKTNMVTLYENTLTTVIIKVADQEKGWIQNYDVRLEGAELISWEGDSLLKFIPKENKVQFHIEKNQKELTKVSLSVRKIPFPNVYLKTGNKRLRSTISVTSLSRLRVEYETRNYRYLYPKDARFRLNECTFFVKQGTVKKLGGDWKDFNRYLNQLKIGDVLVIEVKSFKRKMWNGKIEIINKNQAEIFELEIE